MSNGSKGSKRRKGGLGSNPLDSVIPEAPPPPLKTKEDTQARRVRFTVQLPPDLVEKLRDVAFEDRRTLTDLAEEAFRGLVDRLEKARGEEYPKRSGKLKTGRPIKGGKS